MAVKSIRYLEKFVSSTVARRRSNMVELLGPEVNPWNWKRKKIALWNRSGISMETLPYRLKELFLRSLQQRVLEHLMSLPLLIQLSLDFFRYSCARHEMVRNVGVISCRV
jgi:hypothetical protein